MNKDSNAELIQAGYRYALALTHHHHDAEDLVQIAWERCHRRYGKVRNRAMLYTTIRNRFYDECRRQKIVSFEGIDSAEEPAAESFAPAGGLDLDLLLAHHSLHRAADGGTLDHRTWSPQCGRSIHLFLAR